MSIIILGAVGGIVALANVLGDKCCELARLSAEGKTDEARRLQMQLIHPNQLVSFQCGFSYEFIMSVW